MTWKIQENSLYDGELKTHDHLASHGKLFLHCLGSVAPKSHLSKVVLSSTVHSMALFQNPRGLHGVSSTGAFHQIYTASFPTTNTSSTTMYDRYAAAQTIAEPSPAPGCSQAWQMFFVTQYMYKSSIPKCRICCFQILKRSARYCASFCAVGVIRCSQLSFT